MSSSNVEDCNLFDPDTLYRKSQFKNLSSAHLHASSNLLQIITGPSYSEFFALFFTSPNTITAADNARIRTQSVISRETVLNKDCKTGT